MNFSVQQVAALMEIAAVASIGVYTLFSLHHGALSALRGRDNEHGPLAAVTAMLAGFGVGNLWLIRSTSVADAVPAQTLLLIVTSLAIGPFARLCAVLEGRRDRFFERIAQIYGRVCLIFAACGLGVDPARPVPDWYPGAAVPPQAALTSIAFGLSLGVLVLLLYAWAIALHNARADPDAVVFVFGAGLVLMSVGWDVLAPTVWGAAVPRLTLFAPIPAVLMMSWASIGRFARIDVELAKRTRELASSYDRVRLAQQELVRKEQLAAVGELSAVIAHEVRNPLAVIRNAVAGLRRTEERRSDTDTLLEVLDEEADRLNRLVEDLLAYSKPAAPDRVPVDLGEHVARAVDLACEGQSHRRNIDFQIRVASGQWVVNADPGLLRHALINIVDNAMHAMPEGGTIVIRCRAVAHRDQPAVAVDFLDEGIGMDTLVRRRARDPFFTTRESGTGLGLAIVDRVARVHRGKVEIDSRRGFGTTVTLVLPVEPVDS